MDKTIKKILTKVWVITLTATIVAASVLCLTQLPIVQRFICSNVAERLRETTTLPLSIGAVHFFPFSTVEIERIEVSDADSMPMIAAERIKADISLTSLWGEALRINVIDAERLFLHIRQDSMGHHNIGQIVRHERADTTTSVMPISIGRILAHNCSAYYTTMEGRSYSATQISIDAEGAGITETGRQITVNDISLLTSETNARVHLSTSINMRGDTLTAQGTRVMVGKSHAHIEMAAASWDGNGLTMAQLDAPIVELDSELLTQLRGADTDGIGLSIKADYLTDTIRFERLRLSAASNTFVEISGKIGRWWGKDSIPCATISIAEARTTANDLCRLLQTAPPDSFGIAEYATEIVRACGNVHATPTEAAADIVLRTTDGTVGVKGEANTTDLWKSSFFNLTAETDVSFERFTRGKVGLLYGSFNIEGKHTDNTFKYIYFEGGTERLDLMGHNFRNTEISGVVEPDKINALLDVDDEVGALTAVAEADWSGIEPYLSLTLHARNIKTHKLRLTPTRPEAELSFRMRVETNSLDPNVSESSLYVAGLKYNDSTDSLSSEKFHVVIETMSENERVLTIDSDLAFGSIIGTFDANSIGMELQNQLGAAMPLFQVQNTKSIRPVKADVELTLCRTAQIGRFIIPDLQVSDTAVIRGHIDSNTHSTWFNVALPHVAILGMKARDLHAAVTSDNGIITAGTECRSLILPTLGELCSLRFFTELTNDFISADSEWDRPDGSGPGGHINAEAILRKEERFGTLALVNIDESMLTIQDNDWTIDSCRMEVSTDRLFINNLLITNEEHYVRIDGCASKDLSDTLKIEFNKLIIEDLIKTDEKSKFSVAGDLYAKADLRAALGEVEGDCRVDIERFHIDGDRLDHIDIASTWSSNFQYGDVGINIITEGNRRAVWKGYVDISNNKLNLDIDIDSLSSGFLNFYLDNAIDGWHGTTSGKAKLYGPLDDIQFDARLKMNDDNYFRVKQTNVVYHIDKLDSVILTPEVMLFKDIRFEDRNGHRGVYSGNITHNMYRNLMLNLSFDVEDMLLMETTQKESPTYYGTIYGTGLMTLRGPTDDIKININAQTGQHSTFSVNPSVKSEIDQQNYITFRQTEESDDEESHRPTIDGSVTATLDLHITPDATLTVMIDPQTDNKLSGRGQGYVRVDIDNEGDVMMYGNYTIDEGLYNFSFENIINKQFIINNGGLITWNGSPYDALIDVTATYKLKASLYDLVQGGADEANADLKRRVPINCNILLSNKLTDPDIRFDIKIPSSQNFSQYTFDQYVSTEEEKNRQVFSLLLANKFYAVQDANSQPASQGSSYFGTTASELLSNQLSNWISQNKYNVGVGVNYRPGDEVTNEEYEVALSTQMLDNKIMLSGNIGYGRDASASSQSTGSLIGDFDVEVKLNKQGNVRIKAYTHSNNDVIYETSPTTQGIGISFQEDFDSFRGFFRKYSDAIFRRKGKKAAEQSK